MPIAKQRRNLLIGSLAGILALALVGMAVVIWELIHDLPGHIDYTATAIRTTPDGDVEVLYVPCDDPNEQDDTQVPREPIAGFELRAGERTGEDERTWSTVWQLTLDEPTDLESVILGQVPDDAAEEISWPEGGLENLDADTRFDAYFILEDETTERSSFRLDELDEDTVRFREENLSAEEFARADKCH